MKNTFAEDYAIYQSLCSRYEAAETEEERDAVRRAQAAWRTDLEDNKGKDYVEIYRLYCDAKERGNGQIDISEPHQYQEPRKLVETLRNLGVMYFSFSSSWSGAVEAAWEFQQAGCILDGLFLINGPHKMIGSEEYEQKPAYCFRVDTEEMWGY